MKIKSIIKTCVLAILLISHHACQKYYPMVPPPTISEDDDLDAEFGGGSPYFATVYGAGTMDGSSWDNAMDAQGLRDLLTNYVNLSQKPVYVSEGVYVMSEVEGEGLTISKDISCVKGGFSSSSTGTDISKYSPSEYMTIFSGDVNKNSKADQGDCTLIKLTGGKVTFEGCRFSCGYLDQTLAETLKGLIGAGIYINGTPSATSFTAVDCEFVDNISDVAGNNGAVAGGPCALVYSGYFKARDCRFINNLSANSTNAGGRGGALRTNNDAGCIFLDRCVFSGNKVNHRFGAAIQLTGGHLCVNNSTFAKNVSANGGYGVVNGNGSVLVVNSTILSSGDPDTDVAVRYEGEKNAGSVIVNSVIGSERSSGFGFEVNNDNKSVTSAGGNVFHNIRYGDNNNLSNTVFSTIGTDKIVSALNGSIQDDCYVFDPEELGIAEFSSVQAITDAVKSFDPKRSNFTYAALGLEFYTWVGDTGFMVDQRGQARNIEKMMPGAYDSNLN